jgi:TP901 family phage tail tape measure protein
MTQGSVKNTTGYVNYVYNISARGTTQVASQLMGLSGVTGSILGQLAFQTSSYLSTTEGALLSMGIVATTGFAKATKQATEFDQALATIGAISGKTTGEVSGLGEEAMAMSSKFGVAVNEMTEGLESLARAGVSTGNMNAILEQAMGLSKLEGLSLETAINDLISTTNLLDIEGLDLESPEYAEAVKRQNQRITATSEAAPINAQDIIHTLEHVGGYASSTNLDQEDLFAVIAQLGSKGTKSEMAGTSLRAFLAAGQKDTAQRALKRIGLQVSDLWKNDDTIMSISDMKDVLDEAMEAKGYTKQEKLEFYSDFAGYKQANQIMKIDTTSVREFKVRIDQLCYCCE